MKTYKNHKSMLRILFMMMFFGFGTALSMPVHANEGSKGAQFAQTGDPTPVDPDSEVVSFAQLGISERRLRGFMDSTHVFFTVPSHWELLDGVELRLDILASLQSLDSGSNTSLLEVRFNDVLLDLVTIESTGEHEIVLPVSQEALAGVRKNSRHRLSFTIQSEGDCADYRANSIVLRDTTRLFLPHETSAPSINLVDFPYPIYERSFVPDEVVLVVPENPSNVELQAALDIAAGLGSMTSKSFALSLYPEDKLTEEIKASTHMILVGAADQMSLLGELDLPFSLFDVSGDDGILEMVVSPWNLTKVALLVSGHSDEAVGKAGKAVSSGFIRPGELQNVAVVTSVQPEAFSLEESALDRTLATLGYDRLTLQNDGTSSTEVEFHLPAQQTPVGGAYLDLQFTHSTLLNYDQSGILVRVNGEIVGSVRLSDESANLTSVRLTIPENVLKSGINYMEFEAELRSLAECSRLSDTSAWFSILPESILHLPLLPSESARPQAYTLRNYVDPLAYGPSLNHVVFSLPANDDIAWNTAAQVAFTVGNAANIFMSELMVTFGEVLSSDVQLEYNVIAIGQPKDLPVLGSLEKAMPVAFEPATNNMIDNHMLPASYLVPSTLDSGYLEIFQSPWNDGRVVLAILGNSVTGLQKATDALLIGETRVQLNGDVAILDRENVYVTNSMLGLGVSEDGSRLSEPGDEVDGSASPAGDGLTIPSSSGSSATARPGWLFPALIAAVSVTALLLLGVSFWALRAWRARANDLDLD